MWKIFKNNEKNKITKEEQDNLIKEYIGEKEMEILLKEGFSKKQIAIMAKNNKDIEEGPQKLSLFAYIITWITSFLS